MTDNELINKIVKCFEKYGIVYYDYDVISCRVKFLIERDGKKYYQTSISMMDLHSDNALINFLHYHIYVLDYFEFQGDVP